MSGIDLQPKTDRPAASDTLVTSWSPLQWRRLRGAVAAVLLGLLVTLVAAALIPVDPAQRYAGLQGDMARVRQVHQRIAPGALPIDVAFIGTSHTRNGVADSVVQDQLRRGGQDVSVANLAASWMGRDLHLFLFRQLLTQKRPRLVFVEITDHEYPYGHDVLPYVGDVSDLLCCRPYLDPKFPAHLLLHLKQQLVGLLQAPFAPVAAPPEPFGWLPLDGRWTPPTASAGWLPRSRQQAKEHLYRATANYGIGVLEQMVQLAREHQVQVVFLYLPEYRYAGVEPVVPIARYRQLAPVLQMPVSVVGNPDYWTDSAHLNRRGALELAQVLVESIRQTPWTPLRRP